MRLALLGRPLPDPAQRLELAHAADERDDREGVRRPRDGPHGEPRRKRMLLALRDDRRGRLELDRALGRSVRLRADEDPVTGAAAWRRAAALTTSPATIDSPRSGCACSETSASPVFTAMRS